MSKNTRKLSPAPAHLRPATKAWWRQIVTEFELESHHLRLLKLACEAADRCEQCREILAVEGPVVKDRYDCSKSHPLLAVERDSRAAFARLVSQLNLDAEIVPSAAENRDRK